MKIDSFKEEQAYILGIIDKINTKISSFGFIVESSVARDVRVDVSEFISSFKIQLTKEENLFNSDRLLLNNNDDQVKKTARIIFNDAEALMKRIVAFDTKWSVFEIVNSTRDFCFEFGFLADKIRNRFAMEENLYSSLVTQSTILEN